MTRPVADRDSAPWWQALAEHRLLLQRCESCGLLRWAPRAMCNGCGAFSWTWQEASGRGTVTSWTVSHRAFQPGRAAPYAVLLVRLAEGADLVMPGGWAGTHDDARLRVGLPVAAEYLDLPSEGDADAPCSVVVWHAA